MIDRAAIAHRMDQNDCLALDGRRFLLRIRAKKGDCDRVILHYTDKYLYQRGADSVRCCAMERVACDGYLDYYEGEIEMDAICIRYFFAFHAGGETLYYGNFVFRPAPIENADQMFDCPVVSRQEQRFLVPEWARGATVYQIFPDRFASSAPVPQAKWYKTPMGLRDKLGGDLKGILQKLPYLSELGVEVLYLTPIFLSGSNHKYDTIDYLQVDPEFGTKEDLATLVRAAHERGMRVILDGVFNHTSERFFAFQDLLKNGAASPYAHWYYPLSYPLKAEYNKKPTYLTFGYHGGMPKLNCDDPEVRSYIFRVVTYWMRECDVDGWRLDVADEIGHDFWRSFRKVVRAEKPDALLVGENWFYAPAFLQGDEWDSVMNYHFRDAMVEFVAQGSLTATEFAERLDFIRGNIHPAACGVLWNLIGCHDTPRFLTEAGGDLRKLRLAAAIQLLTQGAPLLYYGDELGMAGGRDPDCRRGMLWDETRADAETLAWYKRLLAVRKTEPAIRRGATRRLFTNDARGILALERIWEGQRVALLFHNGEGEVPLEGCPAGVDLLTGAPFAGTLAPFGAAAVKIG